MHYITFIYCCQVVTNAILTPFSARGGGGMPCPAAFCKSFDAMNCLR
ncbi:MAG: hypothetical protein IJ797_05465 [Selenomonadaceae bacterium]|nr:hypothetical protein [Selenomonadaceae bacterium]